MFLSNWLIIQSYLWGYLRSRITMAVISAARILPSRRRSTAMTRAALPAGPDRGDGQVYQGGAVVDGLRYHPLGQRAVRLGELLPTIWATVRLLAPMSMKAAPSTVSFPSLVAAPVRSSLPNKTSATSFM